MHEATLIDTDNGLRVAVPDSLDLITTYVLREQGDWFEDEIHFVRRVLEPGQYAIDIGANYGLYTLSMAKAVGERGRIWSFEPASQTFDYLTRSLSINGLVNVEADRRGLSSAPGQANLRLNENAELNSLVHEDATETASETVQLSSLDVLMDEYRWPAIDFVKIDAEGEEGRIVEGGQHFFAAFSPLVQYEVIDRNGFQSALLDRFRQIGYRSYRHVPGLNLLVPFSTEIPPDGALINLFCCKPDRAQLLAERGLLVEAGPADLTSLCQPAESLLERWNRDGSYDWPATLGRLPYARHFSHAWQTTGTTRDNQPVLQALTLFAISRDAAIPPADRYQALGASYGMLHQLCQTKASHLRLASLARVARDFGAREVAVKALGALAERTNRTRQIDASEPFLAVSPRFDTIAPGETPGNWVIGSTLEALEKNAHFSSYYAGASGQNRLRTIIQLGYASPEMQRRLSLIDRRFSAQTAQAVPGEAR